MQVIINSRKRESSLFCVYLYTLLLVNVIKHADTNVSQIQNVSVQDNVLLNTHLHTHTLRGGPFPGL